MEIMSNDNSYLGLPKLWCSVYYCTSILRYCLQLFRF